MRVIGFRENPNEATKNDTERDSPPHPAMSIKNRHK